MRINLTNPANTHKQAKYPIQTKHIKGFFNAISTQFFQHLNLTPFDYAPKPHL